jgi:hypothetical protein
VPDALADELAPLLRALRRPRDEAQLTQVIAAVAATDPAFAGRLAKVLVGAAPRSCAVAHVPDQLTCRPERRLADETGSGVGRVDLVFTDPHGPFTLLAELKLHSGYGRRQLERYLSSLTTVPGDQQWLVAVTKSTPHVGEDSVAMDPRWLGSVRWDTIFNDLMRLSLAGQPALERGWRAMLALIRDQGDFGPMDFDPALVTAWAQRDRAEQLMAHTLLELAQPTLAALRTAIGADADDAGAAAILRKGPSQPVFTRKNRMLVKFAVPRDGPELFRIQFLGWDDARFTAEARYQHPGEQLSGRLADASRQAASLGLEVGRDHSGYHWKRRSVSVKSLAPGMAAYDELHREIEETVERCRGSGLLEALAGQTPTTPEAPEPAVEEEGDPSAPA